MPHKNSWLKKGIFGCIGVFVVAIIGLSALFLTASRQSDKFTFLNKREPDLRKYEGSVQLLGPPPKNANEIRFYSLNENFKNVVLQAKNELGGLGYKIVEEKSKQVHFQNKARDESIRILAGKFKSNDPRSPEVSEDGWVTVVVTSKIPEDFVSKTRVIFGD